MKSTKDTWGDIEIFDDVGKRTTNPYVISISRHGAATFYSGFVSKYNDLIFSKNHALLYRSKSNNAIIVRFIGEEKECSLKLTKNGPNIIFAMRSFINKFSYDLEKLIGRYVPYVENIPNLGNCFVIKLNE